jgi:hypothetical protein
VLTNAESTKLLDLGVSDGATLHLVRPPNIHPSAALNVSASNNANSNDSASPASPMPAAQPTATITTQGDQNISFQITPVGNSVRITVNPPVRTTDQQQAQQHIQQMQLAQQQQQQQQQQHADMCQLAAAVRAGNEAEAQALLARGVNALATHNGLSLLQIGENR